MSKILCVLDGFGLSPASKNNVPAISKMPNFKKVLEKYWWYTLNADGDNVGQEEGLVGNSEVGHMNIGGLKLVPQLSYQITKTSFQSFDLNSEFAPDQLFDPKELLKKSFKINQNSKIVHLVGLFSSGTIHSDLRHWVGAIEAVGLSGGEKIVLHIFSDGRDSDRQSLLATWNYFTTEFKERLKPFENILVLGSVGGRFFSMDRDNNWNRVGAGIKSILKIEKQLINDYLVDEEGAYKVLPNTLINECNYTDDQILEIQSAKSSLEKIQKITEINYAKNIFDENLEPLNTNLNEQISKNDNIWLINFRTDRMKQFGKLLTDLNLKFALNLTIFGMNDYCFGGELYLNQKLELTRQKIDIGYYPVFKNQPVQNPLAEYISKLGKTQLHIAETEKYNHVTYFFNGGQNKKWDNEDWVVIDSNKVASHAEKPEMKAKEITDYILDKGLNKYDYIIVNYANPDMVGHTGDIEAGVKSIEFLDEQLGRLFEAVENGGHELIITADHGNIEFMGGYEKNGHILTDTEHNANAVPFIIVSKSFTPEKILQKIQEYSKENSINLDFEMLKSNLEKDNRVQLSQQNWLTANQIPKNVLPLWISGLFLINLD